MPVTVVVGGQFGSEGKGKVSYHFAKELNAKAIVKVGGTNSGHTVYDKLGNKEILRVLPTAALTTDKVCVLPSGSYIDLDVLYEEIQRIPIDENQIIIDNYAMIIVNYMKHDEYTQNLGELIGSTLSGTGAAVIQRLQRTKSIKFAKDISWLKKYCTDTKKYMRNLLDHGEHIIIEGTQGFGLSPINSRFHPFVTSRDTTASAFVAEAGLSPLDVENVVIVFRTFPIRVGGNSGPMFSEIDWNTVAQIAGTNDDITELTSVTKRVRRVGLFDYDLAKEAINVNSPKSIIVMNHMDYIDYSAHDKNIITSTMNEWIHNCELVLSHNIDYIGTSGRDVIKL